MGRQLSMTRLFEALEGAHPSSVDLFWRPVLQLSTFLTVMVVVKLINLVLTARMEAAFAHGSERYQLLEVGAAVGTFLLVVFLLVALLSWGFFKVATPQIALPMMILYLTVATCNVAATAATLVLSTHLVHVSQAHLVVDLALVYAMLVLVFSLWYQLADGHLRGGGLDFPRNSAYPDQPPNWFDYLAVSFFTCSTFGPTIEVARTRPVKALLMLETGISMVILVLAVARIIQVN